MRFDHLPLPNSTVKHRGIWMLTFRPAPALKDLERVGFLSWIIEAVGFGFVRWLEGPGWARRCSVDQLGSAP